MKIFRRQKRLRFLRFQTRNVSIVSIVRIVRIRRQEMTRIGILELFSDDHVHFLFKTVRRFNVNVVSLLRGAWRIFAAVEWKILE